MKYHLVTGIIILLILSSVPTLVLGESIKNSNNKEPLLNTWQHQEGWPKLIRELRKGKKEQRENRVEKRKDKKQEQQEKTK